MALKCLIKIPFCYYYKCWACFLAHKKRHTHREDVSTISQTAELAFNAALLSQRLWRSHQFKWSMHKDMKSRVLDLQSSQVATHTHRKRKLIFQPGMSLGSLELQRQQAFFFLLRAVKNICYWVESDWRSGCAFQMDVCHQMIDVPLAAASTNHTPTIVVLQPSDKQHDKQSHLWGHLSPGAVLPSRPAADRWEELIHWKHTDT